MTIKVIEARNKKHNGKVFDLVDKDTQSGRTVYYTTISGKRYHTCIIDGEDGSRLSFHRGNGIINFDQVEIIND